jgi:pimeloyl-ACP methyl ester carboxylesterase
MTTVAHAREHELGAPDGRRLRVHEAGDPRGELVLVHHGTPGSGILAPWWARDAAERGIRLVGYDRPGYGGSDRHRGRAVAGAALDCATIADALGVERFRTWGVSGGGPHALACAARLPDRVTAVASVASVAPFGAPGLDWHTGMGQDNIDEFGAAAAGADALAPYLAQARAATVAAGPDGLAGVLRSLLPEVDVAALTGDMAGFIHAWMAGGLREGHDGWLDDDLAFVRGGGFDLDAITVPVLVVQGRHDRMVPSAHGRWLAGQVPGATAWLPEEHGHLSLVADLGPVHGWLLEH